MTKFNPQNKEVLTFGEALSPAMGITTQEDADQYKAACIKWTEEALEKEGNESGRTAEEIVNINLAYYAAYYDNETRKRVERLFNTSHPIFGPAN